MLTLDCIGLAIPSFPADVHSAGSVMDLPFSPVRLVLLVGWFYLCVYCVYRLHFSAIVPKRYRTPANVVTLFTGPLLPVSLVGIAAVRKSRQSREGFWGALKQQMHETTADLRTARLRRGRDASALRLLDSAGRSLDEIYGHGQVRRLDARSLDLTESTIAEALDRRASDILIDPKDEATYGIRLRIDGVLRTVRELDAPTCRAVINSIKAVSGMDIAERRRPQDGGFMARKGESLASFRVASAGALNGEKLSIRVLNKQAGAR